MLAGPKLTSGAWFCHLDDNLYTKLNAFSTDHPLLGRVASVPAAAINGALDFGATILGAICQVASVPIGVLSTLFSNEKQKAFKRAIYRLNRSFELVCALPWKLTIGLAAKLISQVAFGIWNPQTVKSMDSGAFVHYDAD